jgi:hypothetical protein
MTVSKRIKLIALLTACIAVAGLQTATAPANAKSSRCSAAVLVLRTLHLEATPSKKAVKPGDKFKVDVKVTRPADEDPLNSGITFERPTSQPAPDVTVGVSIWVGEQTYFFNIGVSDENGEVSLPMRVPNNAESGAAFAAVSGRHWIKQDCPDILEDGFRAYENFVTIKR